VRPAVWRTSASIPKGTASASAEALNAPPCRMTVRPRAPGPERPAPRTADANSGEKAAAGGPCCAGVVSGSRRSVATRAGSRSFRSHVDHGLPPARSSAAVNASAAPSFIPPVTSIDSPSGLGRILYGGPACLPSNVPHCAPSALLWFASCPATRSTPRTIMTLATPPHPRPAAVCLVAEIHVPRTAQNQVPQPSAVRSSATAAENLGGRSARSGDRKSPSPGAKQAYEKGVYPIGSGERVLAPPVPSQKAERASARPPAAS
jgi:hypothetical protein